MHLERYEFEVKDDKYTFFSQGPKGAIKKAVIYHKIQKNKPLYNLSFGDWNEEINWIDDRVITNNGDRQKILGTVATSVLHFMTENSNALILAMGSTPSRTRLYQMNIASYSALIFPLFKIEGFSGNNWHPFETGRNYSAFLLTSRDLVSL